MSKNAKLGSSNYWLHYNLGNTCSKTKRMEEASAAYRTAHALVGWHQSQNNGYYFTHDFFSPNIPDWTRWFSDFITVGPIRALEIGSWQGGSSAWLLDNIISKRPGSRMTCIDTFEGSSEHTAYIASISIEQIFDGNIEKTGFKHLCSKKKGYSQKVLQKIDDEFDFIYIDGAHEAKYVIQDAFLCWGRLCVGGHMLFDDYPFTFHDNPQQNTAVAVDQFISWNESEIEVVERGRQLLLKRIPA